MLGGVGLCALMIVQHWRLMVLYFEVAGARRSGVCSSASVSVRHFSTRAPCPERHGGYNATSNRVSYPFPTPQFFGGDDLGYESVRRAAAASDARQGDASPSQDLSQPCPAPSPPQEPVWYWAVAWQTVGLYLSFIPIGIVPWWVFMGGTFLRWSTAATLLIGPALVVTLWMPLMMWAIARGWNHPAFTAFLWLGQVAFALLPPALLSGALRRSIFHPWQLQGVVMVAAIAAGFLSVNTIAPWFAGSSSFMRGVIRLVLWPLFSEGVMALTRVCSRITMAPQVPHDQALAYATPVMATLALAGRIFTSSMDTLAGTVVLATAISVQELLLRVTVPQRDQACTACGTVLARRLCPARSAAANCCIEPAAVAGPSQFSEVALGVTARVRGVQVPSRLPPRGRQFTGPSISMLGPPGHLSPSFRTTPTPLGPRLGQGVSTPALVTPAGILSAQRLSTHFGFMLADSMSEEAGVLLFLVIGLTLRLPPTPGAAPLSTGDVLARVGTQYALEVATDLGPALLCIAAAWLLRVRLPKLPTRTVLEAAEQHRGTHGASGSGHKSQGPLPGVKLTLPLEQLGRAGMGGGGGQDHGGRTRVLFSRDRSQPSVPVVMGGLDTVAEARDETESPTGRVASASPQPTPRGRLESDAPDPHTAVEVPELVDDSQASGGSPPPSPTSRPAPATPRQPAGCPCVLRAEDADVRSLEQQRLQTYLHDIRQCMGDPVWASLPRRRLLELMAQHSEAQPDGDGLVVFGQRQSSVADMSAAAYAAAMLVLSTEMVAVRLTRAWQRRYPGFVLMFCMGVITATAFMVRLLAGFRARCMDRDEAGVPYFDFC